MEKSAKAPVAKKVGNKTTEIIIGTGSAKLEAGLKALGEVVAKIQELPQLIQEQTLEVTNLEDKIGGLKQEFENAKAQQKFDLQLSYDTDRETFVDKFLNEKGLVSLPNDELKTLKSKLENLTRDFDANVQKDVSKGVAIEKSNSQNALKIAQLEHERKEAANTAEIAQLKQQNQFLAQQAEHWKAMLEKQIENETLRSKNQPAIHVNGTTQGR